MEAASQEGDDWLDIPIEDGSDFKATDQHCLEGKGGGIGRDQAAAEEGLELDENFMDVPLTDEVKNSR